MALRMILLGLLGSLALACGGDPPRSGDPTTAKEKQRREAAAAGEATTGGKGAGWRYTGDRDECFFVVGRRCYKTEATACAAARCSKTKCQVTGGGPATVSCAK
ncbi:MAG TPA: hypothetical protein VK601_18165 [Kofleriaceae bacterium]|nr:hypothetical protein [Kofleriaceae bacterium]